MWITVGVYAAIAFLLAAFADLPLDLNSQRWPSQAWMTLAYVVASAFMTVYRVDRNNGLRRTNETLTEMLYVVALFWVAPWAFVFGRVLAAMVANHFNDMPWQWRIYNGVVYTIVSIVLVRVFLWIAPSSPTDGWRAPMVAVAVWFLNDFIRIGLLSALDWVRFASARRDSLARAFGTSHLRGIACAFGLLIAIAFDAAPWSLIAVVAVGVLFITVSKANARAASLDAGVNEVSRFAAATADAQQPAEVELELLHSIELFGRLVTLAIAVAGPPVDRTLELAVDAVDAGGGQPDEFEHNVGVGLESTPSTDQDLDAGSFDGEIAWSGRQRAGLKPTMASADELFELAAGPPRVTADGRGAVGVWTLDPVRKSFLIVEAAEPTADHTDLWTVVGHLVERARIAIDAVYKSQRLTDLAAREFERARTDPLTALHNRVGATTEVDEWLERVDRTPFSLVLVELLGYQESVNVLGQDFGDAAVLRHADYLRSVADDDDVGYLAHIAAARFLLLVPGDPDRAAAVAERACGDGDDATDEAGPAMSGSKIAVAGIATANRRESSAEELLRAAGIALDRATVDKQIVSFGPTDAATAERRMSIRFQMGAAIDERAIVPEFQPQISLESGRVWGCEVLARWRHPELGQVGPAEFIPVAEQGGQIDRLTLAVTEQALDAARYWGRGDDPLKLSLNLSARSLDSPAFVRAWTRLVEETGRPEASTTIEVTESMLVDRASMILALERMRDLGFRISIDDFGTGYSALSYLDRLPADEVKIDQSMVRPIAPDHPVSPVVNHLIELCDALGLSVCAEGIEDQYQMHVLRSLGVDIAQGYHFSRSLTADAMTTWLAANRIAHADSRDPVNTAQLIDP